MGRGSSKVDSGGARSSKMSASDSDTVERVSASVTFKFFKKNARNGHGELRSLNQAYRDAAGTLGFYESHLENMGTFDNFYKNTSKASIRYMTGKDTWDKKTARGIYSSRKARDKAIIDAAKKALRDIAAEEKRRKAKNK